MAMAAPAARNTYLVEHYRPGISAEELRRCAARLRQTVNQIEREGGQVGYLSATIVPADDYFLSVLDAPSEQLVRDALERAGVPFERISAAIAVRR